MGEKEETSDILDLKVNINDGTQSKPDESNVAFKAARSPISTDSYVPWLFNIKKIVNI